MTKTRVYGALAMIFGLVLVLMPYFAFTETKPHNEQDRFSSLWMDAIGHPTGEAALSSTSRLSLTDILVVGSSLGIAFAAYFAARRFSR